MKSPVDALAEELRDILPYPVLTAWPDAPMEEHTGPVVCVGFNKLSLRPVGLGETGVRLGEYSFAVDVFASDADGVRRAADRLPQALPGLALEGEDVTYRAELKRFSARFSLKRLALFSAEEVEDAPLLSFDWKGEITHEYQP